MTRSLVAVLCLTLVVLGLASVFRLVFFPAPDPNIANRQIESHTQAQDDVRQVLAKRAELDASVWRQEVEAQRYESFFVQLWDRMRPSDSQLHELAKVPVPSITIAKLSSPTRIDHDIDLFDTVSGPTLNASQWRDYIKAFHVKGYRLIQSEWHQLRFEQFKGTPRSTVSVTLHVLNERRDERVVIKGELDVDWSIDAQTPTPERIDASRLQVQRREAPPVFRLAATLPAAQEGATDFVAAYDLDGDGLSEILFGNQIFRNRGNGNFFAERLCPHRDIPLQSAVLADFNADGHTDLLCADPHSLPLMYLADGSGRFSARPIEVGACEKIQAFSTAITAGDVNGDGYVDVWLTQYKPPYQQGQMPTPYYDANDGYPSYLLINNGEGNFVDQTLERGLAAKRYRRTYSSSLVDFDADGDLDLVVVSDFAGLDLYQNDGLGNFHDTTSDMVDQSHNFGMSHVIADFDGDTQLDLFVCGMGSTTARRLDAMQAGPEDGFLETQMRSAMGYGNHMYLSRGGRFVEPEFRHQVARTGWSWGVAEFDFDNDGDRDIYVGNGHISGPSSKDYCSIFWRHDIYTGSSTPDPMLEKLFLGTQQAFQSDGSWNGYEHNCLLMNQGSNGFIETAFPLGLAHEFDTRNIVADDIDANGLVDLLIVEHGVGRPAKLQIWKNYGEDTGNWIGVAISDQPGVLTPGTTVRVRTETTDQMANVVNGDSFNSQHAATLHFGLGNLTHVDAIEITRPDGGTETIRNPQAGKYHVVGHDANGN